MDDFGYEEPGCGEDHNEQKKNEGSDCSGGSGFWDNGYLDDSPSEDSILSVDYKYKIQNSDTFHQSSNSDRILIKPDSSEGGCLSQKTSKRGIHFSDKIQKFEYQPKHTKTEASVKGDTVAYKPKLSRNSIRSKNTRIIIKASKPIVISLEPDKQF